MLTHLDTSLFLRLAALRSEWLDTVMITASAIGGGGFVWLVAAAIAAVYPRHRASAWRTVLAVGLTLLVVDGVMKPLVWRDRPFDALDGVRVIDTRPVTSSFPSGHAASAVAGALAVSRIWPAAAPVWWGLAVLIAVSRVYVGVHYPFDVVAGALVGLLVGYFALGGRHPATMDARAPREAGITVIP
ncbi:MAG: phosphatase PAP2 family protein [Vicinamibacterales bacterium]